MQSLFSEHSTHVLSQEQTGVSPEQSQSATQSQSAIGVQEPSKAHFSHVPQWESSRQATHVLEQEQKGVCPEQSQSSIQQFGIGSQYGGLPVLQVPHAPQSELSLHPTHTCDSQKGNAGFGQSQLVKHSTQVSTLQTLPT